MRLNKKSSQLGFSILELMVVAAIIGIISTLGVTSYNEYILKARQSEAKANLASLYMSEKTFHLMYKGYSSHFKVVGHAPEGVIRYNYGFATETSSAEYRAMRYSGTIPEDAVERAISTGEACPSSSGSNPTALFYKCTLSREGRNGGESSGAPLSLNGSLVSNGVNSLFVAMATSITSTTKAIDMITIDQDKVLKSNSMPSEP